MASKQGREAGTGRFQKIEGRVTKPLFARIDAALLSRLHDVADGSGDGVGQVVEMAVAEYLAKSAGGKASSVDGEDEDDKSGGGIKFRL